MRAYADLRPGLGRIGVSEAFFLYLFGCAGSVETLGIFRCDMWDGSLTRGQTCVPCLGSADS